MCCAREACTCAWQQADVPAHESSRRDDPGWYCGHQAPRTSLFSGSMPLAYYFPALLACVIVCMSAYYCHRRRRSVRVQRIIEARSAGIPPPDVPSSPADFKAPSLTVVICTIQPGANSQQYPLQSVYAAIKSSTTLTFEKCWQKSRRTGRTVERRMARRRAGRPRGSATCARCSAWWALLSAHGVCVGGIRHACASTRTRAHSHSEHALGTFPASSACMHMHPHTQAHTHARRCGNGLFLVAQSANLQEEDRAFARVIRDRALMPEDHQNYRFSLGFRVQGQCLGTDRGIVRIQDQRVVEAGLVFFPG